MVETTDKHRSVLKKFQLSPTRWWNIKQLNAKTTWNIPNHLASLWDDLELVTARKGSTHPLFPVRIDSLLLALLAEKISEKSLEQWPLQPPHWSFHKRILTLGMEDDESLAPENLIDYVLWYGHCWELETNMIVMKSKTPVSQSWALLQNMSRIHRARKLRDREASIYGVMTDGSKWVFMHLTNNSRHTIKVFSWNDERQRIISQIHEIIEQAIGLHSKIRSRSSLPTPTIYEFGDCSIEEMPADDFDDENDQEREQGADEMCMEPLCW